MVAQVPIPTKPYPNTAEMSRDEFEESINRFVPEVGLVAEGMNEVAIEINELAADVEAATAALASAKWVSGTYALGAVVWSPTDFFNYRCKTAGSRTIDPSLDPTNWALQTKTANGGSDTTSSAVDYAIPSTAGRLQIITMTAANKKVTLPPATSLALGSSVFVIRNAGTYRFSIRDNAGGFLCWLNPGQVISLGCSSILTAAGVWTLNGEKLERIYDNLDAEDLNAVGTGDINSAMLSSTKGILAYTQDTDDFPYAVVFNSNETYGTPVQIASTVCTTLALASLSATTAIVAYQNANRHVFAHILTINTNAITVGAVQTIQNVTGSNSCLSLAMLTSTKVLCGYHYTTGTFRERLLSISGNTITASSEVVAETSSTATAGISYDIVRPISATKALSITDYGTRCRLQDTSGATPVPNTNSLGVSVFGDTAWAHAVCILSTSRAVMIKHSQVTLIDISGTTPALLGSKHFPANLRQDGAHIVATKLDANRVYVTWSGGYSLGIDACVVTITDEHKIVLSEPQENIGTMQDTGFKNIAADAIDSRFVMQGYRNASSFLSAKLIEVN